MISIINSRAFGIHIDGILKTSLVPFASLFNHKPEKFVNGQWLYDNDAKGFKIEAFKDIKKGEEITISYGSKRSNFSMFQTYGFIPENNLHDEIHLMVKLDPNDSIYKVKHNELASPMRM